MTRKSVLFATLSIMGIVGWVGWKLSKMFDDLDFNFEANKDDIR